MKERMERKIEREREREWGWAKESKGGMQNEREDGEQKDERLGV